MEQNEVNLEEVKKKEEFQKEAKRQPKILFIVLAVIGFIVLLLGGSFAIYNIKKNINYNKASDSALKYLKEKHNFKNVKVIEVSKYADGDMFSGFGEEMYRIDMILDDKYEFSLFADKDNFAIDKERTHYLAYANLARVFEYVEEEPTFLSVSDIYEKEFQEKITEDLQNKYNVDVEVDVYFDNEKLDKCLKPSLTEKDVRNKLIEVSLNIKIKKVYAKEEKELFAKDMIDLYNEVIDIIEYDKIDTIFLNFNDYNPFVEDPSRPVINRMYIYYDRYEFRFGYENFEVKR